jgi:phage FluMu protein Com
MTDITDALGHDLQNNVVAPTCTEGGYTEVTCSRCDYSSTTDITDALGHDLQNKVVAPTCTEEGYTEVTCSRCDYSNKTDITEATGHTYTYTDNGDGNHTATCTAGDDSFIEAHTFTDGTCICSAVETVEPEEPEEDSKLKLGHALELNSDLSIIYRVKTTNLTDYDMDSAYLEIEKDVYTASGNHEIDQITLSDSYVENGRLCFKFSGVQACEMNSEIRTYLHITDSNGKEYISPLDTYSVCDYARLALESYDDAKMKTLMIDMLNYGAAAQTYFGRNTDNLANAGFEDYQTYATTTVTNVTDDKQTIANADSTGAVTKFGTALNLEARIEIKYTLTLASGVDASDLTIEAKDENGEVLQTWNGAECELDSKGRVVCNFSGCTSTELRKVIYLTAYSNGQVASDTLAYSIESYLPTVQQAMSGSTLESLVQAMIAYGDSAAAYFAN